MSLLHRDQRGVALIMVLGFMALTIPIVTGALKLSSTLSLDSRIKTQIAEGQYGAMGGYSHGLHRLLNEPGFADGLQTDVPFVYPVNLNGGDVDVSVEKISDPKGDPPLTTDSIWSHLDLRATKVANPTQASDQTPTQITYTITVKNWDENPIGLEEIIDGLPEGFTYVPLTTFSTGFPYPGEPTLVDMTDGGGSLPFWELHWTIDPPVTIPSLGTVQLSFDALAVTTPGHYCNEAWVEPGPGKTFTGSGPSARVTVGSPAGNACIDETLSLTADVDPTIGEPGVLNTFTYTITAENTGTTPMDVMWIVHKLPAGFVYANGSTSGITTADPDDPGFGLWWHNCSGFSWFWCAFLGADWDPLFTLDPGEVETLTFQADANVPSGVYASNVWMVPAEQFVGIGDHIHVQSWGTAPVYLLDTFAIIATDPVSGRTVTSEIWVADDFHHVALFEIGR